MSLARLPVELVEELVLCAAAAGDAAAAASLALTCRALHAAIKAARTHLWKHLFLLAFDAPHAPTTYAWANAYQSRVRAARAFGSASAAPAALAGALETLLDTAHTAVPLPPAALAPEPGEAPSTSHPVFPPLAAVLHASPGRIPSSSNLSWLSAVLAPGLPPSLAARVNADTLDFDSAEDAVDGPLARLLAVIGPLPAARAPPPRPFFGPMLPGTIVGEGEALGEGALGEVGDGGGKEAPGVGDPVRSWAGEKPFAWAPERADGVRRLARIRTYDMAYLSSSRLHAPFETLAGAGSDDGSSDADPDYAPTPARRNSTTSLSSTSTSSAHVSPAAHTPASAFPTPAPPMDGIPAALLAAYAREPPPHALAFDWAWLAAARTVVQLNLRDLLAARHARAWAALVALDGLRGGAAPGFVPDEDGDRSDGLFGVDKGREEEDGEGEGEVEGLGEECEGTDWAGVEGQWRRCVCWLDYRDLEEHNAQPRAARFADAQLYEVMRIVPMTLRVARYTRSAHARAPTIHVSGSASGPAAGPLSVWGKVERVARGEVRWSLYTLREDGETAWQSDGAQLGALGSAAGVLGMWTSAEHAPLDPLGPFWMWKVGPLGAPGAGAGVGAAGQVESVQDALRAWDALYATSEPQDSTEPGGASVELEDAYGPTPLLFEGELLG